MGHTWSLNVLVSFFASGINTRVYFLVQPKKSLCQHAQLNVLVGMNEFKSVEKDGEEFKACLKSLKNFLERSSDGQSERREDTQGTATRNKWQ